MFFGCIVKKNKPYNFFKTTNITRLSESCLGEKADDTKVYLKIAIDDCEYDLCVLQKNRVESYKLDHFIGWGEHNKSYKLMVSGGGPSAEVHITGYIEMEDSEDNEDFVPGENFEIRKNNKKEKYENQNKNKKENSIKDLDLNEEKNKENKTQIIQKNGENAGKNAIKGDNATNDTKKNRSINASEANKKEKKQELKKRNDNKNTIKGLLEISNDQEIENLLTKKRKTVDSEIQNLDPNASLNKTNNNNNKNKAENKTIAENNTRYKNNENQLNGNKVNQKKEQKQNN